MKAKNKFSVIQELTSSAFSKEKRRIAKAVRGMINLSALERENEYVRQVKLLGKPKKWEEMTKKEQQEAKKEYLRGKGE